MTARILRTLAAAGAALTWSSSGLAAQTVVPDVPPPGTVVIGPFRTTPGLTISEVGVDDNVFNEAVNPKSDFSFTVTPRAEVVFRMRRLRVIYTGLTDYVYYRRYSSERGSNTSSAVRLEFDLGRLKPYATVQGVNTKARLNGEVDTRARHHDFSYGAGVSFKLASRTSILVNASELKVTFDPDQAFRGFDLEQSFNGSRRTFEGGLAFVLTPITTLSIPISREEQRFQLSSDRDSNTWRVSPTFTFNPSGVVNGSASLGYRHFKGVSPTMPEYSGLVSAVNVHATIYGRHQMHAQVSRDVQYSYDLDNNYYLGTGGTLTWTWLLFGPIDVRGTGGRYLMDYRGGTLVSADTTSSYGGGVGYRFGSRARLGVNIAVSRRNSKNSPDRNFRNQRIFAGLTWGLT